MLLVDTLQTYVQLNVSTLYEVRHDTVTAQGALVLSSIASYRGVQGHLMTIQDAVQNAFVKWIADSSSFWMALEIDVPSGTWVFTAGSDVGNKPTYTHWLYGRPILGSNSSNCAVFNGSSGRWVDAGCGQYFPYVVEYDCGQGYVFGPSSCIGLRHDNLEEEDRFIFLMQTSMLVLPQV